jgi:hypothetical protein
VFVIRELADTLGNAQAWISADLERWVGEVDPQMDPRKRLAKNVGRLNQGYFLLCVVLVDSPRHLDDSLPDLKCPNCNSRQLRTISKTVVVSCKTPRYV